MSFSSVGRHTWACLPFAALGTVLVISRITAQPFLSIFFWFSVGQISGCIMPFSQHGLGFHRRHYFLEHSVLMQHVRPASYLAWHTDLDTTGCLLCSARLPAFVPGGTRVVSLLPQRPLLMLGRLFQARGALSWCGRATYANIGKLCGFRGVLMLLTFSVLSPHAW